MIEVMTAKDSVLVVMRREQRTELLALLERIGSPVLAATRCDEAIEFLQRNTSVGVVLTGMDFADGDWRALLEQARRRRLAIPVVVCSDFPTRELVGSVFERGAFDLLMAPYTEDEVRQIVESALGRSRISALAPPAAEGSLT